MPRLVVAPSQVLYANAHPSVSHMSAGFAAVFGESIRMTRYVLAWIHPLADIETASRVRFVDQGGCPDNHRSTVSYLRIWHTWMGPGKRTRCHFLRRQAHACPNIGFSQPRGARGKRSGTQHGVFW